MARLPAGYLGPFIGKLGTGVGTTWKGIQVIRSRPPLHRKTSTPGQLRQMAKLDLISSVVSGLTSLLNQVYKNTAIRMSPYNKAVSYNIRNAVIGEYPDFQINFPRFVLGSGDLLNPENISVSAVADGKINIEWVDNSGDGSAKETDQIFVALYNKAAGGWKIFADGPERKTRNFVIHVPLFIYGETHVYLGFISADQQYVSTSFYAGALSVF